MRGVAEVERPSVVSEDEIRRTHRERCDHLGARMDWPLWIWSVRARSKCRALPDHHQPDGEQAD